MILDSLRLHNWRQFRGTTPEIRFSGAENSPVTVLFGTNGAGKTALLNAFTWTLYNSTTRGFLFPDQIVNKSALRDAAPGEIVEGWVEIKFKHMGNRFSIRKSAREERQVEVSSTRRVGEPTTELQLCGTDGIWRTENQIAETIGRVLPADLHSYFFFDGERIERIVRPDPKERADIANATKKLIGLEVLERAVRHLVSARKELEKEYGSIGDTETVALLEEKEAVESSATALKSRLVELDSNIASHRDRKSDLEQRLRQLNEVKAIQERRDSLNQDKLGRRNSLDNLGEELSELITKRGYTVFVTEMSTSYTRIIEEKRKKGELPSGIKRQFVDDLLDRDLCICDRGLTEGEFQEARNAVASWKSRAGLGEVEEKAIRMGGEVKQLEFQLQEFYSRLDQCEQRRSIDREQLSKIEQELDSIRDQLQHSPQEEVSELEGQLSAIESAIDSNLQDKGSIKSGIQQNERRLTEIYSKLQKSEAHEERQRIARDRVVAAGEAIQRIGDSKGRFEVNFRGHLLEKIRGLFSVISYTPYVPEIGDDYSLGLRESAGGIPLGVAASQGESQILSLCFIGAIISIAKEYQTKRERLPGPGDSDYPLVMDSPFGSLGPTYRKQIADHVTTIADQVVIMVTNTQWHKEVEASVTDRVGHAYVLQYFSPKEELPRETIEFGGEAHDLIRNSPNDYEYTTVLEVSHG